MKILSFILTLTFASTAFGQYWRALSLQEEALAPYTFAHDDKRVITFEGDGSIKTFDLKTSAVTHLASAEERKLAMQLMARPYLLYSKNINDDHHIFRLKNDGMVPEEDVTPEAGTVNSILGQSYTGRYIYYASYQKSRKKTDFFRYDAQQNVSELVLANDKNYRVNAWSRDQKRLIVSDASLTELTIIDITSTERYPIYKSMNGNHIVQAGWSADNKSILILEKTSSGMQLRQAPMTSTTTVSEEINILKEGIFTSYDISPNGKYLYLITGTGLGRKEEIYDIATMTQVAFPAEARGIVFNQKETLALYHTATGERKLFLYDMGKQTSKELVAKQ